VADLSTQQKKVDKVMEEYSDIFSSPIEVALHCQVKNPIDLTPDTPLPNGPVYPHSLLENDEINIKYKIGSTNRFTDCLSRPPVMTLTMVLDSCGYDTSRWPQLYETDPEFTTTYQILGANIVVNNFHL
jgi:hypothetical protein